MAKKYLSTAYETKASALAEKSSHAEWNYVTNLKNTTARDLTEEINLEVGKFDKAQWKHFIRHFNVDSIQDPATKRQLTILKVIGPAALPDDKLKRVKYLYFPN